MTPKNERGTRTTPSLLEPSMRMRGESCGQFHIEVIQHEEGVQVSQLPGADAAADPGTLALGLLLSLEAQRKLPADDRILDELILDGGGSGGHRAKGLVAGIERGAAQAVDAGNSNGGGERRKRSEPERAEGGDMHAYARHRAEHLSCQFKHKGSVRRTASRTGGGRRGGRKASDLTAAGHEAPVACVRAVARQAATSSNGNPSHTPVLAPFFIGAG